MTSTADPQPAEKCVIIFGAGSTGRGHIGQLADASGFKLVFVDRDAQLVETLSTAGQYTVRLHGATTRDITITGFAVHHLSDEAAIADEMTRCNLILTAVLAENLPQLAQVMSRGISLRAARGVETPLNIVACENMINASSALRDYVFSALDGRYHDYARARVGFPDAMVARVVPTATGVKLTLEAEDYNEWTVDQRRFLGAGPVPDGMELVDNLPARLERKLFMHNTGHAVCGYLGHLKRCALMCDAVVDPEIAAITRGAMIESGEALVRKHGFTRDSIEAYREDFFPRVGARAIADPVQRVIRSPLRKIGRNERLIGPACMCLDYGIEPRNLAAGIAALLRYHAHDDPESEEVQRTVREMGVAETLRKLAGLDIEQYRSLIDLVIASPIWQAREA